MRTDDGFDTFARWAWPLAGDVHLADVLTPTAVALRPRLIMLGPVLLRREEYTRHH